MSHFSILFLILMAFSVGASADPNSNGCVVQEKCIQSIVCQDRGDLDSMYLNSYDESNQRTEITGYTYLATKEMEVLACPVWSPSGTNYVTVKRKLPVQVAIYRASLYVKGHFSDVMDVPVVDRNAVVKKSADKCETARRITLFTHDMCATE